MTTAPRVTPEAIQASIVSEHYFTAMDGAMADDATSSPMTDQQLADNDAYHESLSLLTICVLVLKNGFTVVGTSACVSPENFDEQVGRDIARGKAVDQIWPLMGYALKEKTFIG